MTIDRSEVLRYLGYTGGKIEDSVEDLIDECTDRIARISVPRTVYRVFDINDDMYLDGGIIQLPGRSICRQLMDCSKVILMAATLGIMVDTDIKRAEVAEMSRAIVLDSCASVAVESVCDELQEEIRKVYPYITPRFSPGYGDFPLDMQHIFTSVLDTSRKIGLAATKSNILLPRKSVTAVIGIANKPISGENRGCEFCNMRETCKYRKRGAVCDR